MSTDIVLAPVVGRLAGNVAGVVDAPSVPKVFIKKLVQVKRRGFPLFITRCCFECMEELGPRGLGVPP